MSSYRSATFFLDIRSMSNLFEVLDANFPLTLDIALVVEKYQESVANLFP